MTLFLEWLEELGICIEAVMYEFCILTSSHTTFFWFWMRISLQRFLTLSFQHINSIVNLTAARGTIVYVAPERIGAISYKADVYSFGMEMLDLNRHEVANEENSCQYFPYYIYDKFNKGKEIVVDDEKKMARKLTLVVLWCIQTNPPFDE
ncbi:hypothetical protein RDI58_029114 [Solanum bulbocastanum]|uniref:Uncharacterized protein n=1 Tax=Solanum bulbocastanum TaxID=147425 RepID=A0AAN8XZA9_SOLBU